VVQVREEHVAYWRKKRDEQRADNEALAARARARLPQLVGSLTREFGATEVILFGSLATGEFTDKSDIDLAVRGIPKREFFHALAEVNRTSDIWVDLKPLEDLDEHFGQRVMATGEKLYENVVE
jgi:predicted nucleotidyltransferase